MTSQVVIEFTEIGNGVRDVSMSNHSKLDSDGLASILVQMAQDLLDGVYDTHHVHVN
jgi:hypothetical protein